MGILSKEVPKCLAEAADNARGSRFKLDATFKGKPIGTDEQTGGIIYQCTVEGCEATVTGPGNPPDRRPLSAIAEEIHRRILPTCVQQSTTE